LFFVGVRAGWRRFVAIVGLKNTVRHSARIEIAESTVIRGPGDCFRDVRRRPEMHPESGSITSSRQFVVLHSQYVVQY